MALLGAALVWAALTRADLVVRVSGRVRPISTLAKVFIPGREDIVSAGSGGRVVEVRFREGQEVRRGALALAEVSSDPPFDPQTVESLLFAPLAGKLVRTLNRTMVLELHVARLQGLLEGDTPEERFQASCGACGSLRSPWRSCKSTRCWRASS